MHLSPSPFMERGQGGEVYASEDVHRINNVCAAENDKY